MLTMMVSPIAIGQVGFPAGTPVPTYAFCNVAPNPIGVGQTVSVNFFLATPMETSERPTNMTVKITDPDGTVKTMGPYTGDTTGGSFFSFVPDKVGQYTFQFIYLGQVLTTPGTSWTGMVNQPSQSKPFILTVQEEPIYETAYPATPLPTNYWQTPVSSMNVGNWYKIMGPWLGLGSVTFASTGSYNVSSMCNPYTESVLSGHVLWTKVWCAGGVVGGDAGGDEQSGHYWSTRQYWPQYAPVIMNGIMYSTWYPETTGYSNGILATDLYTGETLWRINTTNPLRCGMVNNVKTINAYGVVGPYIWTTGTLPASDTGGRLIGVAPSQFSAGIPSSFMNTTGTQWNMYSGLTGQYVGSVVNGTSLTLRSDNNGNLIGYYINNTVGAQTVYSPAPGGIATPFGGGYIPTVVNVTGPRLCCFNMTQVIGSSWGWAPTQNGVYDFALGVMWSKKVPTDISGAAISPALSINSITGDAVVMSAGYVHGQGVGGETPGWLVLASMDQDTGEVLMCKNFTYASGAESLLPFTRTTSSFGYGMITIANDVNYRVVAYDVRTGNKVWSTTLQSDSTDGTPNSFDLFSLKSWHGNGVQYWYGLGGDIWALEVRTGSLRWYTNTTRLIGDPGVETPYGIWPLWVFNSMGLTNDVAYFTIGHEYDPPLFHGAQMLAINATNGGLIWGELGTYIRSTSIAYGVMLSLNAYDNQIYAFAKGPSATTVTAPSVGVTTATPMTITGTVMDVSAGTKQNLVAANFPNGLPCVSDASQSKWMEYVYQQQPYPADVEGVKVSFFVLDSNNNYRPIGTTTTNAAGSYGFTWNPDIPGDFMVVANFEGSNSYYPSSARTYFHASEAPGDTPQPTQAPASLADQYLLPATGGIIAAIAIVGVVLALLLRKR
jgi:hypothetical protein